MESGEIIVNYSKNEKGLQVLFVNKSVIWRKCNETGKRSS